jgi:EAL domain-containing protein (putative c-di-GMP-specific phosphodiesterase class I)
MIFRSFIILLFNHLGRLSSLLILLALLSTSVLAIETSLPDGEVSVIVRSEYLVDTDNQLSIDTIRQPETQGDWQALKEDYANFGYQPSPYWYRFVITNPDSSVKNQIVEISYPLLDNIDYFEFIGETALEPVLTGDRVSYASRPIEHPNFLFPIALGPGEKHTIYMRVMTGGSQLVPIKLWDSTKLFVELGKEDALQAMYFGIVSVIIFFNLLIFIALRESMYLYYAMSACLYMLFFAIMRAKLYPYIFSDSPAFHHMLLLLLPSSCMLFSGLFSRKFLQPEQYSKTLSVLLNATIAVACVGLIGVFIFDSQTSLKLSVMSVIPGSFVLLLLGPILGFMGNKMAWVYTAAWSTFMFGAVITALSKQGLMPVSFVTEYGLQLGSVIELFILNAALASRFYREHKQRIAAQEAQLKEINERRGTELKLLKRSMSDPVTSLPNRACFEQQVHRALDARGRTRLAVCVIEVLRYPEISRTLGHHNTELMLKEVAQHFNELLKGLPGIVEIQEASISEYICALEHGSFGILVDADYSEDRADEVNSLLRELMQPIEFKEMRLELRPVIGVAVCPEHGLNAVTLLRHAQVAADSSEAFELNLSYYKPEYDQYNARRLMMVSELKDAIRDGHLALFFQPKFDLKNQSIEGVEALVRWNHERYGLVRPDEFIEIAEQTGIIRSLTRWVVAEAFRAKTEFDSLDYRMNMSINLSAQNLREKDLIDYLIEQANACGIEPNTIYLELTETSMMANPLEAIEVLEKIHALGFHISVDDFGAGYSSLAYLKSLPASEIKIDKSLIAGICKHSSNEIIAKATINMSHQLGLKVVAEGVEDQDIMHRLTELECDSIQGYLLTPPLPFGKIVKWLEDKNSKRFVS